MKRIDINSSIRRRKALHFAYSMAIGILSAFGMNTMSQWDKQIVHDALNSTQRSKNELRSELAPENSENMYYKFRIRIQITLLAIIGLSMCEMFYVFTRAATGEHTKENSILLNYDDDDKKNEITALQPAASSRPLPPSTSLDDPLPDYENIPEFTDLMESIISGNLTLRAAEKRLDSANKRVSFRRVYLNSLGINVELLPFEQFDFRSVEGTCCENAIGYVPLPVGFVGPVKMNGKLWYVPMATTEGALIASAARGCKTLSENAGISCAVVSDFMSRGPVLKANCLKEAINVKQWLESDCGRHAMEEAFTSTSRYARLLSTKVTLSAACYIFIKFMASTGDAMGMNMVSKGCEKCIEIIRQKFPKIQLVSLSGNYCVDKKASSSNWIDGRGKSVLAEAIVDADTVRKYLKVEPAELCRLNLIKNFMGSAIAASQAGASCNAHAANVVAAVFAACGQDIAQVVSSSSCMTWIEVDDHDDSVRVSVTMPSIEVGTVGGGTALEAQAACLRIMGLDGPSMFGQAPGSNAKNLSMLIAAVVMGAEVSLIAALQSNDLVKAHMRLNRSKASLSIKQQQQQPY